MEEELILKQPSDRRLGDNNTLPPGPPGAEFDTVDFDSKNAPPKPPVIEKENSVSERSSRRRSPSGSPPPRKRKSPSRGRRSPSPPARGRGRRSPSPRRNRYRDYSPDRRPRYGGRRSPDRRRSPPPRRGGGRDRYRGRGRSSSRSISRSPTPPRRGGGSSGRWSPKKKPNTPPQQQPPTNLPRQLSQPPPTANQPPPQYGVMAPPPPQLYGEAYGPPPGYNQYGVPPPQTGFVQPTDAYAAMQAQGPGFNTAYPPPNAWGVDAYGQQQWMPPPTQMQQMPPPGPQQQPPPGLVGVPHAGPQIPTNVPPPNAVPPVAVNKHSSMISDEAPGTEPNPQHDAVAQEAENQRDELKKQRTSYLKKTAVLKKELKMLKEQRKDLHSGGAPASPTTKGFIDENEKLQNQIQKKLSTIENVIDMLTGIIGEENLDKDDDQIEDDDLLKEAALSSLQKGHVSERSQQMSSSASSSNTLTSKKKTHSSSSSSDSSTGSSTSSSSDSSSSSETEQTTAGNKEDDDDDSSPERLKKKVIESMKNKEKDVGRATKQEQKGPSKKERYNYVFYDPEMHWCQTCNVFPKTAKDYLNHLHTKNHMDRESIETPWHTDMVTDQFPTYENAPTKRTPIRGLTFFVPATAWFCKLCNIWMGDLHCASTHLKSQLHANRYNAFLEENPHYEVNWLADRQIVLNEQKSTPLPQQITSVSTTAAERKKTKKEDEKLNKKRKKKSDKKQKKKNKKKNKKRKKDSESSSSSSSDSSTSSDSDEPKKKKMPPIEIKELDNPNPGVSIRLSMRKQENLKQDEDVAPPPPQIKPKQMSPSPQQQQQQPPAGKWTVVQEGVRKEGEKDTDDAIIQQWNTVQPVISESEKKLLEQLKGKLKNKSKDEQQQNKTSTSLKPENEKENRERDRDRDRERDRDRGSDGRGERSDRRDRDRDTVTRGRDDRDRRTSRRSRTRSPTRSRSRGRDYRRNVRRSRSRSRGRMSPRGWRGRNRRDRSRTRSPRRRSRSPYDRRRRASSRSRSRSNSRGGSRVEKPIVRPAEFRPRVPEKDKEKDKKSNDNKDKKDKAKPKPSTSSTTTAANAAGKKLPFIGKMPVFKKQTTGAGDITEKRDDNSQQQQQPGSYMYNMDPNNAYNRPPAPTAAQIQMAMMEDAYGNAPPFHPDAGMMVDYDDLMPDPVQFVNIMGQAPPPPPPQATEDDDKDILPPGIDVEESEEFVPKPITEAPPPGKGPLPKDLEDALNIIFPGEKKPGDESDNEDDNDKNHAKGETQIINDEPVMQPEELAKDGIHLVTFEETSQLGLDEASQMSMNEPLIFNRPPSNPTNAVVSIAPADMEIEDANSQPNLDINIEPVPPPPQIETQQNSPQQIQMSLEEERQENPPSPEIPMPVEEQVMMQTIVDNEIHIPSEDNKEEYKEEIAKDYPQVAETKNENIADNLMQPNIDIDLADIPQPPPSPTESEKNRRQEELDDLAMLGIDADDMAAQCM